MPVSDPIYMINYNNKIFRPISNTANGEVDSQMCFKYKQSGNVVTCTYSGNRIISGHLIALVGKNGELEMRYHQVNTQGNLMTGICKSTPEILPNGKIRLYEKWKWTTGDLSEGESTLEED
jgi:hypothetical protein